MAELELIEAAKNGELQVVERLLSSGAQVNEQDDQGWTPLNWAASNGNVEIVTLLLEHGADVTMTDRDNRTSLMTANAANYREVAALLTEAEKKRGVQQGAREASAYCKAYYLRNLRRFEGWSEILLSDGTKWGDEGAQADLTADALSDEHIVYLHQDFTVTKSMWHGEDVIFDNITPAWRTFCETTLGLARLS